MLLVIFLSVHLFFVGSFDFFCSTSYRWLFKEIPAPDLFQNTGPFKFLLETLQGLVDRFVFFYVDNDHLTIFYSFENRSANIEFLFP